MYSSRNIVNKVNGEKYSFYQAAIEWSAVCLSEYRQLKPLTTSTVITLPLFVSTFSYYLKHTHTHTHIYKLYCYIKKTLEETSKGQHNITSYVDC